MIKSYRYMVNAATLLTVSVTLILCGCSGKKANSEVAEESPEQKIENLTAALSRSQMRIEELDAKVSSMADKLDATKLTVDNLSGSKPVATVAVGSAQISKNTKQEQAAANRKAGLAKQPSGENTVHSGSDELSAEFAQAMVLFREGKYSEAELAFQRFAERNPEHILAGSAQYFSGESYVMMGEYTLATGEFSKVISSFSSSPRVASAMARLAQCYEASGATKDAAKTMTLARDLFDGNPSLDQPLPKVESPKKNTPPAPETPAPSKTETTVLPSSNELQTGPMEPHGEERLSEMNRYADAIGE